MKIKTIVTVAALAWMSAGLPAWADSTARGSRGSEHISAASGLMVLGSASVLAGSGHLVVGSVETVGDSVVVVLKGASEAGTASLQVSREVAAAALLAVGTVVQVTAESTGYVLSTAGQVIAFIPNEIGLSLLHQSRYETRN